MTEHVTVIGTGTMGHSIALAIAWAKQPVVLYGISAEELTRAQQGISEKAERMVEEGLLQATSDITPLISYHDDLEQALADTTFIVEAIPEKLTMKHELYQKIESLVSSDVIIASNTSGLKPSDLALGSQHPERFIVTHFWNPAHLIPLVEIVPGAETVEATVLRTKEWIEGIDKKAIVVRQEVPGFIGNRLQFALFREAQALYDAGVATKEDIDAAVTYSIGRRLPITGPLMSADFGGLDIFKDISDYLFDDLSTLKAAGAGLNELVSYGHVGVRSGRGYYEWNEAEMNDVATKREKLLMRFLLEDRNNKGDA